MKYNQLPARQAAGRAHSLGCPMPVVKWGVPNPAELCLNPVAPSKKFASKRMTHQYESSHSCNLAIVW